MPLSQEQAVELLRFTRERVKAAGLADFDEAVVEDLPSADVLPGELIVSYLRALDAEFALRSSRTPEATLEELKRFAFGDGLDREINGVRVLLGETDAALADADEIDLIADLPDLAEQRAELQELISTLEDEMRPRG